MVGVLADGRRNRVAKEKVSLRARLGVPRARDLLTVRNLAKIPTNLGLIRGFMQAVNWQEASQEIAGTLATKIAIVGQPNTGKSTLFNTLKGQRLSPVSAEPGSTSTLIRGVFGPFTLIDTPGHLPDKMATAVDEAGAIVMLLDATKGLRQEDRQLYRELKQKEKPIIVALNKVDAVNLDPDDFAADVGIELGADVIPISARHGTNVAEELVPEMINTSPEVALVIGRELPFFRREAASKLIRNATMLSLAAGLEPVPLVDIPILLGTQIRLVLRIAALYGEPPTANYAREVVTTVAGGLLLRYLAEETAKAVPFGGDLVSGAIAAAGTWAIGQVALEYFAGGKQLSRAQIRSMYRRIYETFRETVRDILATSGSTGVAQELGEPAPPRARNTQPLR
jgi:small GTP-binding protein